MSKAATLQYVVTTNMATDDNVHTIGAAYYQHEDRFTIFKDSEGGLLASFANDHIVAIERRSR
jgi:hypothetical protein